MTVTATDIAYAKWICETKLTFKNPKDARATARERISADQSLNRLFTYRCPACRCYHLTKKPNRYGPIATRRAVVRAAAAMAPKEKAE